MAEKRKTKTKPRSRGSTQSKPHKPTNAKSHKPSSNGTSKAMVPLLAGGAALAGAAGGMVLGARQARRHHHGDFSRAAKEVGSFGAQVGRLASELHQARESAANGKHRSPLEVVLEGLTARRSG
jgi:uncharacterized protein HemX